jgi:hypothetical protein
MKAHSTIAGFAAAASKAPTQHGAVSVVADANRFVGRTAAIECVDARACVTGFLERSCSRIATTRRGERRSINPKEIRSRPRQAATEAEETRSSHRS